MNVVKYQAKKTNHTVRYALTVKVSRKWMHLILLDHPIRVIKVLTTEQEFMEDTTHKVSKVKRVIKNMARSYYGTLHKAPKNVREALR
jgi:hypothetical protein